MSATMNDMELKKVDILSPGQLMEEDLIMVDDEIVSIVAIDEDADNYYIEHVNDFGEREVTTFVYNDTVDLYYFVDED